jgi:hypothetical protein
MQEENLAAKGENKYPKTEKDLLEKLEPLLSEELRRRESQQNET